MIYHDLDLEPAVSGSTSDSAVCERDRRASIPSSPIAEPRVAEDTWSLDESLSRMLRRPMFRQSTNPSCSGETTEHVKLDANRQEPFDRATYHKSLFSMQKAQLSNAISEDCPSPPGGGTQIEQSRREPSASNMNDTKMHLTNSFSRLDCMDLRAFPENKGELCRDRNLKNSHDANVPVPAILTPARSSKSRTVDFSDSYTDEMPSLELTYVPFQDESDQETPGIHSDPFEEHFKNVPGRKGSHNLARGNIFSKRHQSASCNYSQAVHSRMIKLYYASAHREIFKGLESKSRTGSVPVTSPFHVQTLSTDFQFAADDGPSKQDQYQKTDQVCGLKRTPSVVAPDTSFYRIVEASNTQSDTSSVPESIRRSRARLFPVLTSNPYLISRTSDETDCLLTPEASKIRLTQTSGTPLSGLRFSRAYMARLSKPLARDYATKSSLMARPVLNSIEDNRQDSYKNIETTQTASLSVRELCSMQLQGIDFPALQVEPACREAQMQGGEDEWKDSLKIRVSSWRSKMRNRKKLQLWAACGIKPEDYRNSLGRISAAVAKVEPNPLQSPFANVAWQTPKKCSIGRSITSKIPVKTSAAKCKTLPPARTTEFRKLDREPIRLRNRFSEPVNKLKPLTKKSGVIAASLNDQIESVSEYLCTVPAKLDTRSRKSSSKIPVLSERFRLRKYTEIPIMSNKCSTVFSGIDLRKRKDCRLHTCSVSPFRKVKQ